MKITNTLIILLWLYSFAIILDMILPVKQEKEIVLKLKAYPLESRGEHPSHIDWVYGFISDKGTYATSKNLCNSLKKNDTITTFRTKLFGELTKIKKRDHMIQNHDFTIYKAYSLLPVLSIFTLILALFFRNKNHQRFIGSLILSIVLFIMLSYVMISNNYL